jgi:hypothetical protein
MTVHCAFPASGDTQLVVKLKSVGLVPFIRMLLITTEKFPLFITVTGRAAPNVVVPNARDNGEMVTGKFVPVPLNATFPAPETVNVPVREPVAAGLKATLMEQFAPAAKVAVQEPPARLPGRTNSALEKMMLIGCAVTAGFWTFTV